MLKQIYQELVTEIQNNKYDFLQFNKIDQCNINNYGRELFYKHNTIIIIGFGASSLNIRALASSLSKPLKKIIYLDSLDQLEIETNLTSISLDESVIFSLSKSGNSSETYLLTKYLLENKRISPKSMYIISPFGDNLLYKLVKDFGTNHLEHDVTTSGRFNNIISISSLLPALVIGVDIDTIILSSLKIIKDIILDGSHIINLAQYYLDNYFLKRHIFVIFNYCYQLDGICRWQQQMIAESLGKNNFGITPIIARGTFDQHSQLQLYLEGPDDKFYKIMILGNNNLVKKHNSNFTSDLVMHANNIYRALINTERPVILENFEYINEQLIAKELIESMLVTIIIAKYQGFNPFNQPSVDKYKSNIY